VATWGTRGNGTRELLFPRGLAVDRVGCVFVADTVNHRVHKFSSEGELLRTWGERGAELGQFDYPYGLATDWAGNLYLADLNNDRVQKFSGAGQLRFVWTS
jgi:sugar lactone lactonase YvrE